MVVGRAVGRSVAFFREGVFHGGLLDYGAGFVGCGIVTSRSDSICSVLRMIKASRVYKCSYTAAEV